MCGAQQLLGRTEHNIDNVWGASGKVSTTHTRSPQRSHIVHGQTVLKCVQDSQISEIHTRSKVNVGKSLMWKGVCVHW